MALLFLRDSKIVIFAPEILLSFARKLKLATSVALLSSCYYNSSQLSLYHNLVPAVCQDDDIAMKVHTPLIAWHNRERVSSADFQPVAYPDGKSRLATGGDDKHVIVSPTISS